jgi:hypothetical protein
MKDRLRASRESMAQTLAFRQPEDRTPTHWLRGDARGRYDGIREKLAAEGAERDAVHAPRVPLGGLTIGTGVGNARFTNRSTSTKD